MKNPLWARLKIPLATTKEKVWSALTLPEFTKAYMFNCELHCSWELGSEAIWKEIHQDGTATPHVRGELLVYQPYTSLCFKMFHQREGLIGKTSELRYTLSPYTKGVLLTVEQGDFSTFPQAEIIYAECVSGWTQIQDKLKATCLSVK